MSSELEIAPYLDLFKKSFDSGRLAHAYLIVGAPDGAGGFLAERILSLLYCESASEKPCSQCAKCRRVAARVHPDVQWIEPQKKSRGILKEQIDAVREQIKLTSLEGGWKAVVFLHADRLNPVAANRLLKTLEEPPDKSLFLLVTDQPEVLLPTIVSRCQRVALAGGMMSRAGSRLRAAVIEIMSGVEGTGLFPAIERSRKGMDALKQVREEIENAVKTGNGENEDAVAAEDSKASKDSREARIEGLYKKACMELFRLLVLWQRDILLHIAGITGSVAPEFAEQTQAIEGQAAALTYRRVMDNINVIEDTRRQAEQSLPIPMILERGLIRLTSEPPSRKYAAE